MPDRKKSIEAVKDEKGKQQVKNQNQHHNSKKEALGPNTKR